MTSPPPPPNRRRRRQIIVAFVLVLAGVAWWKWPRGDARFVGKWQVSTVDYSSSEPSQSFARTVVLRPNGLGNEYDYKGQLISTFSWSIKGDRYVVGTPTTNATVNGLIDRFQRRLPKSLQCRVSVGADVRIDSVSDAAIKMSSIHWPSETTMTRVRE
jgi:hypothetical protein